MSLGKSAMVIFMSLGVMILFDIVANLGGGVVATHGLGATTLVASESTVGGVAHCPAMIAVSSWMAWMCLIFCSGLCWHITTNYLEEVCCHCNGEVLQSNWYLAVGWVQAPHVR
jgi:hypothetical protein